MTKRDRKNAVLLLRRRAEEVHLRLWRCEPNDDAPLGILRRAFETALDASARGLPGAENLLHSVLGVWDSRVPAGVHDRVVKAQLNDEDRDRIRALEEVVAAEVEWQDFCDRCDLEERTRTRDGSP